MYEGLSNLSDAARSYIKEARLLLYSFQDIANAVTDGAYLGASGAVSKEVAEEIYNFIRYELSETERQFDAVRDYFITLGDELTESDYREALHFLEVNDKITHPTNEQVIAEVERLIEIEMESLDEEACF